MRSPNILFIFSDDHAVQAISSYGGPLRNVAPTPGIDRIAREGALFRNSFCANSICGPSRANVLTGVHSHINGFVDNENSRFDGTQPTFPSLLRDAGYETAVVGKWHLISDPVGFDHWDILPGQGSYWNPDFLRSGGVREREKGHVTSITTRKAIDWLERRRDPNRPYLLLCQHKAPHRNWMPAPEHMELFKGVRFPQPTTLFDDWSGRSDLLRGNRMRVSEDLTWVSDLKAPRGPAGSDPRDRNGELDRMDATQRALWESTIGKEGREFLREVESGRLGPRDLIRAKWHRYLLDYLRCVRGVDDSVRTLLDWVDRSGTAEDTIVVYASDQGFYLGEHGWYDKRWIFEESLRMPLAIRWPRRIRPGSRPSELVQNIDYAPTFLEAAGVRVPDRMQGSSLIPLLDGKHPPNWREEIYYRYTGEQTHSVPAHDGIRTKRHKLVRFPKTGEWNLFDLESDPNELRSIHADPKAAGLLAQMQRRYQSTRQRYGVPPDHP
ncbi:MAG: sulfatase [Armatimonadota bacterium]